MGFEVTSICSKLVEWVDPWDGGNVIRHLDKLAVSASDMLQRKKLERSLLTVAVEV